MTIDMTTSSVEEKSGKLLCFMEELHMFTDWANGHLDAFGLSRAPSLLFKAVSNCNGNGRNSASPYRMCLSAQTFELLGGNNGYRYGNFLKLN